MSIPALTECQKAILWLMYFWQFSGFKQIARPKLGTPHRPSEDERTGWDRHGRPLGTLGLGTNVLLTHDGLMRTTWLWRYSTDANQLHSVDRALVELPASRLFGSGEILAAMTSLVHHDRFISVKATGCGDATKVRAVQIAQDLVLSVGVAVSREFGHYQYSAVPGLAYWLSDTAAATREIDGADYEPITVIDGRSYRNSEHMSGKLMSLAFINSQRDPEAPPSIEALIPKTGVLVPLKHFAIQCGKCGTTHARSVLLLSSDVCPHCKVRLRLCEMGMEAMMGDVDAPDDISFLALPSFRLSDGGYQIARELFAQRWPWENTASMATLSRRSVIASTGDMGYPSDWTFVNVRREPVAQKRATIEQAEQDMVAELAKYPGYKEFIKRNTEVFRSLYAEARGGRLLTRAAGRDIAEQMARKFPRNGGLPVSWFKHWVSLRHPPNRGRPCSSADVEIAIETLIERGVVELVEATNAGPSYDGAKRKPPENSYRLVCRSGKSRRPSSLPVRPGLNETDQKALKYIKEHPGTAGRMVAKAADVSERHFTSRIVPKLRAYGVFNNDGYRWKRLRNSKRA